MPAGQDAALPSPQVREERERLGTVSESAATPAGGSAAPSDTESGPDTAKSPRRGATRKTADAEEASRNRTSYVRPSCTNEPIFACALSFDSPASPCSRCDADPSLPVPLSFVPGPVARLTVSEQAHARAGCVDAGLRASVHHVHAAPSSIDPAVANSTSRKHAPSRQTARFGFPVALFCPFSPACSAIPVTLHFPRHTPVSGIYSTS